MHGTNIIQQCISDFGVVISSATEAATSPIDKLSLFLLMFDLVLWAFLPFVLLLVLWRISAIARQLGRTALVLSNMTEVIGESIKDQTAAVHHLRDRTQAGFESLNKNIDQHGELVQLSARDTIKEMDRMDGHIQSGSMDIAKQLANLYDRLGKFMALNGMKGVGEIDEPTEDDMKNG